MASQRRCRKNFPLDVLHGFAAKAIRARHDWLVTPSGVGRINSMFDVFRFVRGDVGKLPVGPPRHSMAQSSFIAFSGSADRFPILKRVFDRIREVKPQCIDLDFDARGAVIDDPAWIDLLDDASIATMSRPDAWKFENILDCMLTGEYDLLSVSFSDVGRLKYDPQAFPFGGTDPIRALIESFGFTVTHDSCYES